MISGGSDTSYRKQSVVNRRMFILSAAKLFVFGGIVAKLFSLQINQNKKYLTLSDKNRLREWKLPPIRGDFQDFFGNTIAGNLKVYQLHIIPEQVENFNNLIIRVKDILELDKDDIKKLSRKDPNDDNELNHDAYYYASRFYHTKLFNNEFLNKLYQDLDEEYNDED